MTISAILIAVPWILFAAALAEANDSRPMLDYQMARFGDLDVEDGQALLPVYLTASDGELVGYLFILGKQKSAPCDRCWITDTVLRFEASSV